MPPIEALLGVLRGGALLPTEALSLFRALVSKGDTTAPVEWARIIRADPAPIAEWAALSATDRSALIEEWAALSATDRSALIEWFRTLAALARPPAESGATAPAPILYVSRGRLR
jgi:hypothetical protein